MILFGPFTSGVTEMSEIAHFSDIVNLAITSDVGVYIKSLCIFKP